MYDVRCQHFYAWHRRVDILELPRLQLSFTSRRGTDDPTVRMYSDDHLGYYLSNYLTPGIRRVIEVCGGGVERRGHGGA